MNIYELEKIPECVDTRAELHRKTGWSSRVTLEVVLKEGKMSRFYGSIGQKIVRVK